MGCADDVIPAINDLSDYIDDIPGAGFVIDHVFPGNSDTK